MRRSLPYLFALAVGLAGVVLRAAIPVGPVDDAFRQVLRFYDSLGQHAR